VKNVARQRGATAFSGVVKTLSSLSTAVIQYFGLAIISQSVPSFSSEWVFCWILFIRLLPWFLYPYSLPDQNSSWILLIHGLLVNCTQHCRSQWSSGSVNDCDVREPRFESHCGHLCSSWQPLWYIALGTGCTPLLQCLGWLSLTLFDDGDGGEMMGMVARWREWWDDGKVRWRRWWDDVDDGEMTGMVRWRGWWDD